MKALIIDANALLFRVYHALPRLTDPQGRPIQAVYGLANLLWKIISEVKPDYLFSCWDRPEPTFRHQQYKEYKAQRPPIADDFKSQLPLAKKLLQAFRVPILEYPGYEADDLIATVKEILLPKVEEIIILTGDLDTLQLVDAKTKIYTMKKGLRELKLYGEVEVHERYGLSPKQMVDFKALVGDPSDNIKGVPGVGEKTASKLLQKYQTLEKIILAAEQGFLEPKLRQAILSEKERLIFQKNLLTLKKDIPLPISLVKYPGPDYQALAKIFAEFGFRSLRKRLEPLVQEKPETEFTQKSLSVLETKELPKVPANEKIFAFWSAEKIYLYWQNQVKVLPKEKAGEIFLLPGKKILWPGKAFWKEALSQESYFEQKVSLTEIFDLQVLFWLIEPNLGRYSLKEAITFLLPKLPLTINFPEYLAYLEEFWEKIEDKMNQLSLWRVYQEIERPLTPILARMELTGIKVDRSKIQKVKERCLQEVAKLKKEIQDLAGMPFNPLSTKEVKYVLFQKLKLPTKGLAKTAKGELSTQESELAKISQSHPIVNKILAYRKLVKIASTYTDSLLVSYDPTDGRVHPTYKQTGTSTGRLSAENPNVQNIPLQGELADLVREIFLPEKGFLFLAGDYSQLELRLAAHLSQEENLLTALREDLDIHSQTAKLVFGQENPQTRRMAKAINFGIIYGMQAKGLAERLQISISEAQKIIQRYFQIYPGLQKMRQDLIEKAKTYGYAETLFGRKLLLPEIYSRSYREKAFAERVAINMPIQGLGADIIKKAMIAIEQAIYQNHFVGEANLLFTIHDELIFEVSEKILDSFHKLVQSKMENIISLSVPLKVKIKMGDHLGKVK